MYISHICPHIYSLMLGVSKRFGRKAKFTNQGAAGRSVVGGSGVADLGTTPID